MENAQTNNLDRYINVYKEKLIDLGVMDSAQIDEADEYLYTESIELIKTGLTEDEAFSVAKIRFGSPEDISSEYNKVQSNNFLYKIALYTFFGLFAVKLTTLLCKIPLIGIMILKDYGFDDPMGKGILSPIFSIVACFGAMAYIVISLLLFLRKQKARLIIEKLIRRWYFPLLYLAVWILDRTFFYLFFGSIGDFYSSHLWVLLTSNNTVSVLIFNVVVTIYLLVQSRRKSNYKLV